MYIYILYRENTHYIKNNKHNTNINQVCFPCIVALSQKATRLPKKHWAPVRAIQSAFACSSAAATSCRTARIWRISPLFTMGRIMGRMRRWEYGQIIILQYGNDNGIPFIPM